MNAPDYIECPSCGCMDMRLAITEEEEALVRTAIECAHCCQLVNGVGVVKRAEEPSDDGEVN